MRVSSAEARRVVAFVSRLSTSIHEAWRRCEFSEESFSDIAVDALTANPPTASLDYLDVACWLAEVDTLPNQVRLDESFGQPPVTLYWDGRFQIDMLHWLAGTPAIHQHGFGGAFAVIEGSSIHCHFKFALRRQINSHFLVGLTHREQLEILERSAIRHIPRGHGLIHSLFHLDTPSVTLVVRTCEDPGSRPEYVYFPPSIALDPSHVDALRTRRLQMVEMLIRVRNPKASDVVARILEVCDLHTAFLLLLKLHRRDFMLESYERGLSAVSARYGSQIEKEIAAAVLEESRRVPILALRQATQDSRHRFLLGLLVNVQEPAVVYRAVEARYRGGDPESLVNEWLQELGLEVGL